MAIVYRNITGPVNDPQGNLANGVLKAKSLRPLVDNLIFVSPEELRVDIVDGLFTLVLASPVMYDFEIIDTNGETWWNFQAPLDNDSAADISLAELYVASGYVEQTFDLPVIAISDLLDVVVIGAVDHEHLIWDATAAAWVNHQPELGELYEDNDGGSTVDLTVIGTYYGWVTATAGALDGVVADTSNVTADTLSPVEDGRYETRATVSFEGDANTTVTGCIHVNGVPQANIKFDRKLGTTGDVGAAMCSGILDLSAGDLVDLRFTADFANRNIGIFRCNLLVHRI